ncbi:hydroxycarboxylic acid receptor 2-like [Carassius carassius]|uniref:hydroxycarboxylic acid receptor 2-like n=1 Tax=Carassius carassius TaxID=217509 RepID=UPI0028688888|nr:hydroxycarboxylic acid receptor 2-like [Carassius carassius]
MNSSTPDSYANSTTPSIELIVYLEMCVFTFNFLFGLLTHSYVIWLIVTGNGIASEFFILNLSVCEIGNSLNSLFFMLSTVFSCLTTIVVILQGLTITGRPLFQCLMCVERYLAVVHPVTFLKYKPLRYRVICCSVTWIITLGSCLICLIMFFFSTIAMNACFYSVQFLLYLPIQLFCLVAVLRALKQSGPGERGREREQETHMKTRAFYLILITTVTMTITYVPNTVTGLFTIVSDQLNSIIWVPSMICFILAGFVQPVLYLHRAGKLSRLCTQ